jgi:hypothetical protein
MDMLNHADNDLYVQGNTCNRYPGWADYELFSCCNDFCVTGPNTDPGTATHLATRHPYPAISLLAPADVRPYMCSQAGAFPRDAQDARLTGYVCTGNIPALHDSIIAADDPFTIPNTTAGVLSDADDDGMPDYWETAHGLNPNQQDHNGSDLSLSVTGVAGYTNLEVYLNCLADALVQGGTPACGITLGAANPLPETSFALIPNPSTGIVLLELPSQAKSKVLVQDLNGRTLQVAETLGKQQLTLDLRGLASGVYVVRVNGTAKRLVLE